MYSIASSASSKPRTESMMSSNFICDTERAAHKSSMSSFEPALMPLNQTLANRTFREIAMGDMDDLPENHPPIDDDWNQLFQLVGILLGQVSNLTDDAAAASALDTLDQ